MLFLAIAVICAGISTLLGHGRTRTFGFVVTIATLLMVGGSYPAYKKHMNQYLERAKEQSTTIPDLSSTDP